MIKHFCDICGAEASADKSIKGHILVPERKWQREGYGPETPCYEVIAVFNAFNERQDCQNEHVPDLCVGCQIKLLEDALSTLRPKHTDVTVEDGAVVIRTAVKPKFPPNTELAEGSKRRLRPEVGGSVDDGRVVKKFTVNGRACESDFSAVSYDTVRRLAVDGNGTAVDLTRLARVLFYEKGKVGKATIMAPGTSIVLQEGMVFHVVPEPEDGSV
jgi:hypothetical protein